MLSGRRGRGFRAPLWGVAAVLAAAAPAVVGCSPGPNDPPVGATTGPTVPTASAQIASTTPSGPVAGSTPSSGTAGSTAGSTARTSTPPVLPTAPTSTPPPSSRTTPTPTRSVPPTAPTTPTTTPTQSTRPPVSGPLFSGARFAAGVDAVPSHGGVRLTSTDRGPLAGKVVVLDPGHNGRFSTRIDNHQVPAGNGQYKNCNSSGTATNGGFSEHAYNWDTALDLAAVLRERGATVILTRGNDHGYGPCVDERAAIANRAHADLLLSIHADGNDAASARGFHVIASTSMAGGSKVEAASLRDARTVRDAFEAGTPMPRSTYIGGGTAISPRSDLGGLNLCVRPAVMIETGNMRNPTDARLLTSASFRATAATALAAGIQRVLLG